MEWGLSASLLLLPPLLALVPHGAVVVASFAGLCAAALIAVGPQASFAALRRPALIVAALVVWGGLSAFWSIDPARSLILDIRLLGLFGAGLALAAAAERITVPWRASACLAAGIAIAIALVVIDLASAGGITHLVSVRPFQAARLNQIAAWLAILALPVAALLWLNGRRTAAAIGLIAMAATVGMLDGTAAKFAFALSLPVAAFMWWKRHAFASIAAVLAILGILGAPLILPRLAQVPPLFARVDALKGSAGHRLVIWQFTGERIAERPFLGWGLDSARTIPGGAVQFRPGQRRLPLHPHDAALQLWLELGAPGGALFALLLGLLWLRVGEAPWPRVYVAAAGGSFAAASFVAFTAWGIWQEWWLGTLGLALFAILVMGRAIPPRQPGSRDADR